MIVVIATMVISSILTGLAVMVVEFLKRKKAKPAVSELKETLPTGTYLGNTEKAHLSILEEKENQEPYRITLWWGLDGVRLNDAGQVEWISRRKEPISNSNCIKLGNTFYFHSPYLAGPINQWNCMEQSIDAGIRNMTNGINSNIQSQIESIRRLQLQAAQMAQNDYILNHMGRDVMGRFIR